MAPGSIKRKKPAELLSVSPGKQVTSDSKSSDRIPVRKTVREFLLQQSRIPEAEVELIQRAADVLGWDRVAAWLQNPVSSLSGRIPYSLLGPEEGRKEVSAVLGRIEHGVY